MYYLTVLHAHAHAQTSTLAAGGQMVLDSLAGESSRLVTGIPEMFKECRYLHCPPPSSHQQKRRRDHGECGGDAYNALVDELVSIEKKEWPTSQSWGDQFPRLTVQKRNAYTFVVLSTNDDDDDDNARDRQQQNISHEISQDPLQIKHVVGYCVMYIHALHGQLSKLWIRREERNKGCATFLISYALDYIKTIVMMRSPRDFSIVLFVETENRAAINVYSKRIGFSIEPPTLVDYYHHGSHAYRMRLNL